MSYRRMLLQLVGLAAALLLQQASAFVVPSRQSSAAQRPTVLSPFSVSTELPTVPGSAKSTSKSGLTVLSTVASKSVCWNNGDNSEFQPQPMSNFAKKLTKAGAIAFIVTVALGLISSLSFIRLLGKLGISTETRRQKLALSTGQFVARWALRLFPFCKVQVIADKDADYMKDPEPCVWVCNHMSMMDVFLLLASDRKMRGRHKRPIKVVYWKKLEDNPFTKILFRQSGFIPIDMAANKPGESNEYDKSSFRSFLKESKQAFVDGFDIGVLPEGQLNPTPEKGLMPLFSGAFTLARMSRRPIQMIALHGVNQLWHPDDGMEVGDMNVTGRDVKIRVYPAPRKYDSDDDFKQTFSAVVGHFGKCGRDVDDLDQWLDGSKWREMEETKKVLAKKALAAQQAHELLHRKLLERRLTK